MAFLKTSLRILSILILLVLNTTKIKSQDYSFESIKTFEGPYNEPEYENRNYRSTFDNDNTRFIWCEVMLKNNLYLVRQHTHNVEWKFYKPDGSSFGNASAAWTMESEWASSYMSRSFGWNESGKWTPGKYTVDFYLDGKYIASVSFFITGSNYSNPTIKFLELKFFESSTNVPAYSDRVFSTTFPKSRTRYVYYQVTADNLQHNIADSYVTLKATYFKPNQEIFGEPVLNYNIPSAWSSCYLYHGWGWNDPGNWDPGNYYVEIYYQNRLFASGYFTITNN